MAVDISPQQKYYRKLVNYSLRFSFLGDKVRAMQHIQNHIETEVYKYAKDEFEATIKGRRWRHLVCTHVMHTCGLITLLIPEFLFTKGPTTHPDDNHLPTLEAAGTTKHNLSAEELVKKLKLHNEVFVHTQWEFITHIISLNIDGPPPLQAKPDRSTLCWFHHPTSLNAPPGNTYLKNLSKLPQNYRIWLYTLSRSLPIDRLNYYFPLFSKKTTRELRGVRESFHRRDCNATNRLLAEKLVTKQKLARRLQKRASRFEDECNATHLQFNVGFSTTNTWIDIYQKVLPVREKTVVLLGLATKITRRWDCIVLLSGMKQGVAYPILHNQVIILCCKTIFWTVFACKRMPKNNLHPRIMGSCMKEATAGLNVGTWLLILSMQQPRGSNRVTLQTKWVVLIRQ